MREETTKVEAEAGATQGGRRPSGVAPAAGAMTGGLAPGTDPTYLEFGNCLDINNKSQLMNLGNNPSLNEPLRTRLKTD
jgi:hypothetical protein